VSAIPATRRWAFNTLTLIIKECWGTSVCVNDDLLVLSLGIRYILVLDFSVVGYSIIVIALNSASTSI
jgi:hypothetical protein